MTKHDKPPFLLAISNDIMPPITEDEEHFRNLMKASDYYNQASLLMPLTFFFRNVPTEQKADFVKAAVEEIIKFNDAMRQLAISQFGDEVICEEELKEVVFADEVVLLSESTPRVMANQLIEEVLRLRKVVSDEAESPPA